MIFPHFFKPLYAVALASVLWTGSAAVLAQSAQVKVDGAWIRFAVPGQGGTGAFMNLTAKQTTRLVGVSTPVAGIAEVHEMRMDGDIMKMRPAPVLELPAGKTIQLKPSGYHVMLMDLKAPLAKGASMPMTLLFRDSKGVESKLEITLPIASKAPAAPSSQPAAHDMKSHKH